MVDYTGNATPAPGIARGAEMLADIRARFGVRPSSTTLAAIRGDEGDWPVR